jgi:Domain of unknown function (DUF4157)
MNVRTGFPWWLRPFLQKDVVAITLWRRVYLSEKLAGEALQRILAHELVHVRQLERVGLLRFYWRYLREYVANRRAGMPPPEAYRRISFEQEALIIERSVTAEDA